MITPDEFVGWLWSNWYLILGAIIFLPIIGALILKGMIGLMFRGESYPVERNERGSTVTAPMEWNGETLYNMKENGMTWQGLKHETGLTQRQIQYRMDKFKKNHRID